MCRLAGLDAGNGRLDALSLGGVNRKLTEKLSVQIPAIAEPENWEEVEIDECNEPLVLLESVDGIVPFSEYSRRGYKSALEQTYVRLGVRSKLYQAANFLPPDHKLVIFDGWRPKALQKELFDELHQRNRKEHPDLSDQEITEMTETYVTYPNDDPMAANPHLTGGAVDLNICDATYSPLSMGTNFDEFSPKSRTRYYEELLAANKELSPDELRYLRNRRLLFHAMSTVGFTNYAEEWWHYDYGNQFWSKLTGQQAIYGPALKVANA